MTHITCYECGGNEHITGYGLTCGPMGSYTICDCGALLEFCPDLDGVPDDAAKRILESVDIWRRQANAKRREKGLPEI